MKELINELEVKNRNTQRSILYYINDNVSSSTLPLRKILNEIEKEIEQSDVTKWTTS